MFKTFHKLIKRGFITFQITENSNNEKKELELCDGWYSMKATIDYEMEVFILRNIVSIGTKIVISGADVINNDSGCHPLEVQSCSLTSFIG